MKEELTDFLDKDFPYTDGRIVQYLISHGYLYAMVDSPDASDNLEIHDLNEYYLEKIKTKYKDVRLPAKDGVLMTINYILFHERIQDGFILIRDEGISRQDNWREQMFYIHEDENGNEIKRTLLFDQLDKDRHYKNVGDFILALNNVGINIGKYNTYGKEI